MPPGGMGPLEQERHRDVDYAPWTLPPRCLLGGTVLSHPPARRHAPEIQAGHAPGGAGGGHGSRGVVHRLPVHADDGGARAPLGLQAGDGGLPRLVGAGRDVLARRSTAPRDTGTLRAGRALGPGSNAGGPTRGRRLEWASRSAGAQAFTFPCLLPSDVPTWMRLGCTSGSLDSRRWRTPSFKSATQCSTSTPSGSVNERLNEPKLRS